MKTIYPLLVLSFVLVLTSLSSVQADETVCEWMRRLKAQQPIFMKPDSGNLLVVKRVKNPSVEEAKQKKTPGEGAYYFLWEEYNSKVTVFVGGKHSLELSVPKFKSRPISVKWINPKLIYIDISFDPHYGAYWIYDVEQKKIISHELENDGWDAWQQCGAQEIKTDNE
jgi:hypothetical protein